MPTTDPVGTALAGIGAGAATGAAVVTAGALSLRLLQTGGAASTEIGSLLLGGSAFAGLIVAVIVGWVRTQAIDDVWRRAVAGAVSAFGTVLLGLGAPLADMAAGPVGMVVYLALLLAAAVGAHRAARRAASQ